MTTRESVGADLRLGEATRSRGARSSAGEMECIPGWKVRRQQCEAERHRLQNEQLSRALASRDIVGQAKGILMERHNVTAAAAFDMLRDCSRQGHMRLVLVAAVLVTTGAMPDRPTTGATRSRDAPPRLGDQHS